MCVVLFATCPWGSIMSVVCYERVCCVLCAVCVVLFATCPWGSIMSVVCYERVCCVLCVLCCLLPVPGGRS